MKKYLLIPKFRTLFLFATCTALIMGCTTTPPSFEPEKGSSLVESHVDFTDPVLNARKIFLFGPTDQQVSLVTIQKLLYLDDKGNDPIDLFLVTPGGDIKYAWAIVQTLRLIDSPVNTYALSECNSGGVMILAAGTGKRSASQESVIILHGLKIHGKPPVDYAETLQESYNDFWISHTLLPKSWLPLPFNSHHVLTAKEAIDYGIVDELFDE